MRSFLTNIAKAFLQLFPAYPAPNYLESTDDSGMRCAREEFGDERAGGFLKFFGGRIKLSGGIILDLGCGYGGRTVEYQRLVRGHTIGLEISPRMAASALRFARSMNTDDISFVAGAGESLPFTSDSIDLVLCYDVFEHVEYPEQCLAECWRVLKPGGMFLLVFPPYFHPTGSHLEGYVSHAPYANLIFPRQILLRAIDEILEDRKDVYRPLPLRLHDKLYSLNGLTLRRFKEILKRSDFEVVSLKLLPLFSKMNRKYDAWKMQYYGWMFYLLPHIPVVQECFTHRVVAVLRRPINVGKQTP